MKNTKSLKLIKSIVLLFLAIPFLALSQVPESFKYQAVVRNVSGTLIANQNVTIKSSILSSDVNGMVVYAETQNVTTTEFGLIHLNIGQGTVVQGSFSAIPWGDTSYFLKTEFDLNGSGNFQFIGVTQLLAVPYALYAKTSGSSIPGPQGPAGPQGPIGPAGPPCLGDYTHFIGEEFGGGIVFHVYRDATGNEHGLIVSKYEPASIPYWSNVGNSAIGNNARSSWNGLANSLAIVAQSGHTNSAAKVCLDYVEDGFSDWYLASYSEMQLLFANSFNVNKVLSQIPNAIEFKEGNNYKSYSTSTEFSNSTAIYFSFRLYPFSDGTKSAPGLTYWIRPIRAF
jgi:hypothetical protein